MVAQHLRSYNYFAALVKRLSHGYSQPCSVLSQNKFLFLSLTSNEPCSRGFPSISMPCTRLIHTSLVADAGHSKWSNIKHIKAAQDKEKGGKSDMLAKKVESVLVSNPQTDPKLNSALAELIKWARSNNIPNNVIDKTIERMVKLRDPANITAFDGRGPSNTGIVIECQSLKPNHTKSLLQGIVKKFGFNLHSSGSDLFEHKGVILAEVPEKDRAAAQTESDTFPLDNYIDVAIEASAEDVTLEPDEEKPLLQFICGPQDLSKVHASLNKEGLEVVSAERRYVPTHVVPVSKEFIETLEKLIDKLEGHPDVINYYFNVELSES